MIIVGRRQADSNAAIPAWKYLPCPQCRSFLVGSTLWQHNKSCYGKLGSNIKDAKRDAQALLDPFIAFGENKTNESEASEPDEAAIDEVLQCMKETKKTLIFLQYVGGTKLYEDLHG